VASIGRNVTSHVYSADVSSSWELDFFGRLQSLNDQALQQYFASAQARKAFEISLVAQVADQYLTMLADEELLAVTRNTLETARASYDLTRQQFDVGTGTELSLRQAETVVEQAKANYAAQVRARAQDENTLVLLLGQPLPADLPPLVALYSQSILADIPAGVPSDLLTRRPDIMEAEANLRGANANIGAARAAFFPTISLTGSYGSESTALSRLFHGGSLAWTFVPSITVPIFEGGRLRASLDVATIQKDINVAQYEKTIQTAFQEVANDLAARGTYDDQVAALERDVAASQRYLDLAQQRFLAGVDSYLNVLTAQNSLYSAQQALVSARVARLTTLVSLYKDLGGGWVEHTGDTPAAPEDRRVSRAEERCAMGSLNLGVDWPAMTEARNDDFSSEPHVQRNRGLCIRRAHFASERICRSQARLCRIRHRSSDGSGYHRNYGQEPSRNAVDGVHHLEC